MSRLLDGLSAVLALPMLALLVGGWLLARAFRRTCAACAPRPEESAWDRLPPAAPAHRMPRPGGARLASSFPARRTVRVGSARRIHPAELN